MSSHAYDWNKAYTTDYNNLGFYREKVKVFVNDIEVFDVTIAVTGPTGFVEKLLLDEEGNYFLLDCLVANVRIEGNVRLEFEG